MYFIEKEINKLVYFTLIVCMWVLCVRVYVCGRRSCNNYVSVNITSEEKKSAFDLAFNPPISINVFFRRRVE